MKNSLKKEAIIILSKSIQASCNNIAKKIYLLQSLEGKNYLSRCKYGKMQSSVNNLDVHAKKLLKNSVIQTGKTRAI